MRIISGTAKGRRLASFRGRTIRPTSEKVREAVFDILAGFLPFHRVLDVFAGTGAMGIEAMSRGAREAVFIDTDRHAASLVRENLERTGFSTRARVLQMAVKDAIRLLTARKERFELIFIDPPYDYSLSDRVLTDIELHGLLSPSGIVVYESSRKLQGRARHETLECFKERTYGDTVVCFYRSVERNCQA